MRFTTPGTGCESSWHATATPSARRNTATSSRVARCLAYLAAYLDEAGLPDGGSPVWRARRGKPRASTCRPHLVRPGVVLVLERVAAERKQARKETWGRVETMLTSFLRDELDGMLVPDPLLGRTTIE